MKGNDKPKSLSETVVQVVSCKLYQEICIKKILSPCLYPFRGMAWFNMASQRSKVELAPPVGKICAIQDGNANLKTGYF